MNKREQREISHLVRRQRRTELDWRDHLETVGHVIWPILFALALGGFGFVIMVASHR